MRKSEFRWLIWACHSRFSRYRVLNYQNWLKIVVFTNFFPIVSYYYSTTNTNRQIPKKSSSSVTTRLIIPIFCMRPWIDEIMAVCQCHFIMVLFLRPFFPLFPLFSVYQKGVFSIFLKMGNNYFFGHKNHSKQLHKVRLSEMYRFDDFLLTFWKKMILC